MSYLDKRVLLKANLETRNITEEKQSEIFFYNTDENIANLYMKLIYVTDDGLSKELQNDEVSGYSLKMTAIKPKTNQIREVDGVLSEDLSNNEGTCAIFKFQLGTEFTNQIGDVICCTKIIKDAQKLNMDYFVYTIKADKLTGLNAEITSNPDLPVLKQLIKEVKETAQTVNNIDNVNVSDTKTYSNKKIEEKFSGVSSQIKDIENKNNIKWRTFDKGYITIVVDDFQDDLGDVFSIFKSKNIPLSCAIPTIKIEQGKDITVLHDIEKNKGEILSHGYTSNPITSQSTIDFIKTEFEKSKFLLEKKGLRINGYVRAGGDGSISFANILDLFYKNYIYGFSMGEDNLLFGRESLIMTFDDFKNKVNTAIANKQWVKFYFHGLNEISLELLTQMLDYINTSGIMPTTYLYMYQNFLTGNTSTELNVQKSDILSSINYTKKIDDRTVYREDVNLLKNSALVDFENDTKWIKDKSNYNNYVYWNVYDRGFYSALRVNLSDKSTIGTVKIYQDTGLSRINIGEILHAGLTVQQQTDNNSVTLRLYKQLQGEPNLTMVSEKTYTGKLSDEYIYTEWVGDASLEVTNFRYEIELNHPDITSSNLTYLYLPRLTFKRIDNRYNNITY